MKAQTNKSTKNIDEFSANPHAIMFIVYAVLFVAWIGVQLNA
jgi:hypothetical protein